MVKVKVRTGRGTGTIEVEVGDLKFSGEEFKKIQAESLGEKSKTWEDVAELLRQTLKSLEEILIICGSAL